MSAMSGRGAMSGHGCDERSGVAVLGPAGDAVVLTMPEATRFITHARQMIAEATATTH
ncbi:hypothetical protein ACVDFE_34020 [Lentzea chajnantorensis]